MKDKQDFDWRSLKLRTDIILVQYKDTVRVFECSIIKWSPSGDFFQISTEGHTEWVRKNNLIFLEILKQKEDLSGTSLGVGTLSNLTEKDVERRKR